MFFEKNADALCKNEVNKNVVALLRQVQPSDEVEIYETEDGGLTIKYKSAFLHDVNGSITEARKMCDDLCQPSMRSFHILFGLGLGYLLQELRTRSPKGKVIIYEPNLPLLRYVLDNVDLSKYLGTDHLYLASQRKYFAFLIQSAYNFGEKVEIYIPRGYVDLMGGEINDILKEELTGIIKNEKNGTGLSMMFQDEWSKHFLLNTPYFPSSYTLPLLRDRFTNKPALLISAGPSLEAAMPTIKEIVGQVVLIAIGQTLDILHKNGIIPDFAVFLDYEGPTKQLANIPHSVTQEISFIMGPFAHPICYETPAKHHFSVNTDNYIDFSLWYDETFKTNVHRITSGSSVSLMSLQCSFMMGCNPIILIGQDLAFRGKQIYAGAGDANITDDGMLIRDDIESLKHMKFNLEEVKGQNGEILKTGPDYAWFVNQFRNVGGDMKSARPAVRLINASVGGALLENFEHFSMDALVQEGLFSPQNSLDLIPTSEFLTQGKIQQRSELLINGLKNLISAVDDCIKYAKMGHEQAALMLKSPHSKWSDQNKQLIYARKEFTKRLENNHLIAYFLRSDILLLYRNYHLEIDNLEHIIKNLTMDSQYYESCANRLEEKLKAWAQEALSQIEEKVSLVETCLK